MKPIELNVFGQSCRIFPDASVDALTAFCVPDNTVIVSDTNICRHHSYKLLSYRVIEIEPGEAHKTLETVNMIYDRFCDMGVDRTTTIVGVGGGIVCDIAGFAASTYLRGLTFGFVPTTLLAQVDAGVGGKNGVNFRGYKNLVGTFTQPQFVLCDLSFLRTLPDDELKNGIAEIVKTALIKDRTLFEYIESNRAKIPSLDRDTLRTIINGSLKIKTDIVSEDAKESGERRKLNFGHTIGHAIEKTGKYRHGEAISIGMSLAAKLSETRGTLNGDGVLRITALLEAFGLPTRFEGDRNMIMDAVAKDKKREGDGIHFVFLDSIGNAVCEKIGIGELEEAIFDLR